ncbi:GNAT family N-acetyltransferase [Rickettsiales bacterium]|nr:GNAT family N-acetyltransferase [Rickettsiales bacterium]MDB2550696.1 GNAT family N-acetyltransferase [Rickettsiales bacterium]
MSNIEVKDINSKEIMDSYYLIIQSYPNLTKEEYSDTVKEMMELSNFKMIGAFIDNQIIGISGYVISKMFYCAKFLRISNLIIDKNHRNQKIGTKMIHFLEEKARNNNCKHVILDSFIGNKKSHSLYFREGFFIRGLHFMKEL